MPIEPTTAAAAGPVGPMAPMGAQPAPAEEFAAAGPEWNVQGVEGLGPEGAPPGAPPAQEGFGSMLTDSVQKLQDTQSEAAGAARSLADGTATDISAVVMAVERAKLSMQLAAQVRNKAVESYQEIFRTQV
jgi:flagellar hook-basal body complex protein FliE